MLGHHLPVPVVCVCSLVAEWHSQVLYIFARVLLFCIYRRIIDYVKHMSCLCLKAETPLWSVVFLNCLTEIATASQNIQKDLLL